MTRVLLVGIFVVILLPMPIVVGLTQILPAWNAVLLSFVYGLHAGTWYAQWVMHRADVDAATMYMEDGDERP